MLAHRLVNVLVLEVVRRWENRRKAYHFVGLVDVAVGVEGRYVARAVMLSGVNRDLQAVDPEFVVAKIVRARRRNSE